MKKILCLMGILITLTIASSASAVPVSLTYTGVTNWQAADAYFPGVGRLTTEAGYYQMTISSIGNTYGFCIDPAYSQNKTLQYDLRSIAEGSVYERAAYLLANSTAANAAATQIAVWKLTIPGFHYYSGVSGDIQGLYNQAMNLTTAQLAAFNQSGFSLAVNPIAASPSNGSGAQDFLVRGTTSVPEPSSVLLIGFGLAGLGIFRRVGKR